MPSDIGRPRWAMLLEGLSWAGHWVRARAPRLQPVPGTHADSDRRKSERFLCELMATCRVVTLLTFRPLPAKVRDMSAGGVGLLLRQPLEVGSFLILDLADASGGKGTRLCVKLAHCTKEDAGIWRIGCVIVQEAVGQREPEEEGRLILSP